MVTTPDQLIIRQALYRLSGSLFLYPDTDLLQELKSGVNGLLSLHDLWSDSLYNDSLLKLTELILKLDNAQHPQVINQYNRLFMIKPRVSPYETSYYDLPGQLDSVVSAQISGIYADAGLVIDPDLNELPDHIAVELEFMSFLVEQEINAFENPEPESLVQVQKKQRDFMLEHIARWFPGFAKKTIKETEEDSFYRGVIEAVYAFLRTELAYLGISP